MNLSFYPASNITEFLMCHQLHCISGGWTRNDSGPTEADGSLCLGTQGEHPLATPDLGHIPLQAAERGQPRQGTAQSRGLA